VCVSQWVGRRTLYKASGFGWAPCGFAAIPTAAIDPPQRAASPAVPAPIGSGSPSCCFRNVGNLLELAEQVGMILCKVAHDADIAEEP
jgi:hypothetical protein